MNFVCTRPPKRCCLIILGSLFSCQIMYTLWLSLSQGSTDDGILVSPRVANAISNRTLITLTTKKVVASNKGRYPRRDKGFNSLRLSDAERQGPVMPASIQNIAKSRGSEKTSPFKKRAVEVVSHVFSQNSTESPPLNILEHFQLHSKKMAQFCVQNNYSGEMPQNNYTREELVHHLLYDDSKRIIFCYVPKSGCSNWKRMFAVLNGTVRPNDTERPSKQILQGVNKLQDLTETEQERRIQHYFKFSFIRNPLERIVSAYRNKIAVPINYTNRFYWPDRILFYIIQRYDKEQYTKWSKTNFTSAEFRPSFGGFVKYLSYYSSLDLYNEHFRPFIDLCHPCSVNYNFIGNFYNIPDEAYRVMTFLGIPHNYYLNRSEHPTFNTSSMVSDYYSKLTRGLKVRLVQRFSQELLMYYQLYPAESQRDLTMLGLREFFTKS